jgi:hypothetical protein
MGNKLAENVIIFDKVDDTNSFGPLNDPPVFGVVYLVKYFHISCKFLSHINSILSKNTGHDRGNTSAFLNLLMVKSNEWKMRIFVKPFVIIHQQMSLMHQAGQFILVLSLPYTS